MKLEKPSLKEVDGTDLSPMFPLFNFFPEVVNGDKNYLDSTAGVEHYKLLGWLSNQFQNSLISEIGTCDGMGLLALSLNKSNNVVSYDIFDYDRKHQVPSNGKRVICEREFNFYQDIVKSEVIFYDAQHQGDAELEFVKKLIEMNYKGILVFDDIKLNEPMKQFWSRLESMNLRVEDWTDIGHYEGTGVIFFG